MCEDVLILMPPANEAAGPKEAALTVRIAVVDRANRKRGRGFAAQ